MSYERFSELWDALVTNRPRSTNPNLSPCTECSMTEATKIALIEYGQGNTSKFDVIRKSLGR